jgi:hypothetical protein
MLESEKFAIAAHLHVLLRRTTGRVTDVEWMIRNVDYAREVIRVARAEEHLDLRKLADKLEAVVMASRPQQAAMSTSSPPSPSRAAAKVASDAAGPPSSGFAASSSFGAAGAEPVAGLKRYVGSLR